MRLLRRKRLPKAAGYRSNEWKGPRSAHSMDQRQRAKHIDRVARCRRALCLSGRLAGAGALCWTILIVSQQLGPVLHRGLEIKHVSVEGMHQVTKQEVIDRFGLKKGLAQYQVSLSYLAERVRTHPGSGSDRRAVALLSCAYGLERAPQRLSSRVQQSHR